MAEFNSLMSLQEHFSSELICMQYLEEERWEGNPECPHCGSEHHYRTKTRFSNPELKDYKDFICKACRKKYTVLTGTIYESSKVSLKKWFMAMYLLEMHKKGVSSMQLARDIEVTQKTAWFMLHRIREMLKEKAPEMLEGVVMSDETFVGGKNKNRHHDKKVKKSQGRSFKDKTPVFGLMQEGGFVRCFVVSDTKAASIQPLVLSNVKQGSTVYTDEWWAYKGLSKYYDHHVIDHGRGQYKNGDATTNAIEGFWSHLKRSIIGIYHYVSKKHLQKYCHEFSFRYNYRDLSIFEKFRLSIRRCNDVRLLYKVLVGT